MKVQVKKVERKKMLHDLSHSVDKKVHNKNLIAAKPRERVDSSTRNKDVLGICNR
ncbi:MAG: hypothetical protein GX808_06500 [Syntrophomonadaceae bacterium]|jgi:hypothetical protein|nr:hypothetical protein [Syntrophomonadaceae bacterium]